jgi:serine/threonine protein kinase
LLDSSWTAKVADFGTSKLISPEKQEELTFNLGTIAWMAPEMLVKNRNYTEKVDVYSFGIIAWEMVVKEFPYKHIATQFSCNIADVVLSGERPITPVTCPEWFSELMKKCWSKNPEERPSFTEIVLLLEQQVQYFIHSLSF